MPDNYHEELVAFCKRLKIASAMADRAETTEGETHVEFLYNLLKREIELRDQAHIENIIKDANFPVQYTFDNSEPMRWNFPMTAESKISSRYSSCATTRTSLCTVVPEQEKRCSQSA